MCTFFSCSIFIVGVANVHFHVYFIPDLVHMGDIIRDSLRQLGEYKVP